MDCIFNENLIVHGREWHVRQFRENQSGRRSPIFTNNAATVEMEADGLRYRILTERGEVWAMGTGGISEALDVIRYADPDADIFVKSGRKRQTIEEYRRSIAPIIFRIHYTERRHDGAIFIAMDAVRNGRKLGEWAGQDLDIGRIIAETIDETGVQNHEIHWGREPLAGYEAKETYKLPHLANKAKRIKEMDTHGEEEETQTATA